MLKKREIFISVLITVIALAAYMYLFVYADRKIVFLYEHLGFKPFDKITIGRYWMAGLVLSGFLSIMYLISQLLLKFVIKADLMSCRRMVKYIAIPLMTGVVGIIMALGEPKLPFFVAVSSAFALIFGMAVVFCVADDFVKDARQTIIYLISGVGLVPFLILFRVLELPGKGMLTMDFSVWIVILSMIVGFIWLLISYRIFRQDRPKMINVLKGILAIGYVGLPLLHYFIATPEGIPYITSSDNFFADNILLRIVNWILLIVIVFLAEKLTGRKYLVTGKS